MFYTHTPRCSSSTPVPLSYRRLREMNGPDPSAEPPVSSVIDSRPRAPSPVPLNASRLCMVCTSMLVGTGRSTLNCELCFYRRCDKCARDLHSKLRQCAVCTKADVACKMFVCDFYRQPSFCHNMAHPSCFHRVMMGSVTTAWCGWCVIDRGAGLTHAMSSAKASPSEMQSSEQDCKARSAMLAAEEAALKAEDDTKNAALLKTAADLKVVAAEASATAAWHSKTLNKLSGVLYDVEPELIAPPPPRAAAVAAATVVRVGTPFAK